MPSYIVNCPQNRLSAAQKDRIAATIARVHGDTTGAPYYFAQVTFSETAPGNYYLGGKAFPGDQIFVHGVVREGRPTEMKNRLMAALADGVANAAEMQMNCVWVYLSELPPNQMIEFGRVLPLHGQEEAWTAALPAAEKQRLESLAITA